MAGLFCLQLAIRKNPIVFSFLAGVFFAFGFWFKQVAAFQVIAVGIWLVLNIGLSLSSKVDRIKYIKISFGYATGGILTSIPFFGYLYLESGIFNWWNNAFQFNQLFAAESQKATSLNDYLKILFPISREFGYQSSFWAISPFILCVVTFQVFAFRETVFRLPKANKEVLSLFVLTGLVCWFGYFPLPHQFHTQLFMAPTFVVIGLLLGKHPYIFVGAKKYAIGFLAIYIFLFAAIYENYHHMRGWNKKRKAINRDLIAVNLNSSFDGLKIDSRTEKSLTQFYKNLVELKTTNETVEFIPLSVDPLRGLLPGKIESPSKFKMGVDWTWPNELVEPGFSDLKNSRIMLGKQPIYADSLIYIPGYVPTAILEMKSPLSSVHTLYKPILEMSELQVVYQKKSNILYATKNDFDINTRSNVFDWDNDLKFFNLIPFNNLSKFEIEKIENLHISVIHEEEFPRRLSALQMKYLNEAGKLNSENLQKLFSSDEYGGGTLRENINTEDEKNLAFMMLTTGKLFVNQNRPIYSTSLSLSSLNRPMVVSYSKQDRSIQVLWRKGVVGTPSNEKIKKDENTTLYIATNSIINKEKAKFIIFQIENSSGQTKSYYYIFEND
jgi:hypothetical protein